MAFILKKHNLIKHGFYYFLIFTVLLIFSTSNVRAVSADDVTITAEVKYNITIKVHPEKRIPLLNHWLNTNVVEIRQPGSTTSLVTQIVNMGNDGVGDMAPIEIAYLPVGTYDIAIKGYSHLRKVFPNKTLDANTIYLDFTGSDQELVAGDTSVTEDNFVNSLDISNTSRNLYTSDLKNDLNRDGIVNSLDMSNISTNIYKAGNN
jgi:hypothetical protein